VSYGSQSMTAPLRRVLVRAPGEDFSRWREYGWRSEPDAKRIAVEHDAFCEALASEGAEIVVAESAADGNPDAIYVYDPALIAESGAILLRPGKKKRRGEAKAMAADLAAAGVPITAELTEPACARGRRHDVARREEPARRPRLPNQ
jgi:dimethylargininase